MLKVSKRMFVSVSVVHPHGCGIAWGPCSPALQSIMGEVVLPVASPRKRSKFKIWRTVATEHISLSHSPWYSRKIESRTILRQGLSISRSSNHPSDYVWRQDFQEAIQIKWDHRAGGLERRGRAKSPSPCTRMEESTREHTARAHTLAYSEKVALARKRPSPEAHQAGTVSSDFQLPERWESEVLLHQSPGPWCSVTASWYKMDFMCMVLVVGKALWLFAFVKPNCTPKTYIYYRIQFCFDKSVLR